MKHTIVISAFPASGKSYIVNKYGNELLMIDSDSSNYSWKKDDKSGNRVRNPDFPNNYIKHIIDNIGKVDVIFVSSHKEVRKALRDNNIKYFIVYPKLNMKDEFIHRMIQRGNSSDFIKNIDENFEKYIKEIEEECKEVNDTSNMKSSFGFYYTLCYEIRLNEEEPYINFDMILLLLDKSMGNLCQLWHN